LLKQTSHVDASSQIKVLDASNSIEVRLNFKIGVLPENKDIVLLLINSFGGLLSYNKLNNEYTYSSNSYGSARKIIKYFDEYHLQSTKYIDFIR
jgi:hypothetical protein